MIKLYSDSNREILILLAVTLIHLSSLKFYIHYDIFIHLNTYIVFLLQNYITIIL
jgi:hypothetical protein